VSSQGVASVNNVELYERDAAAIKDEGTLTITAIVDAELVLVDAP
jgi:quercetin 2,3-dioxygenase